MASRPKPAAEPREGNPRIDRASSKAHPPRAGSTREAVREIVRRYRETFERLGR